MSSSIRVRKSSASVASGSSYGSRRSSKGLLKKAVIGRMFSGRASDLSRAIMTENWMMVITIMENHPQLAKIWTKCPGFFDGHKESSLLPIHQACSFHAPPSALEAMINAYPKCLNERETGYDRLPVHIACHSAVGIEVLRVLLADYPESAAVKDMVGRIPLHYACSNGASLDTVQLLIDASPSSVRTTDFNGWIPLHVACRVGTSPEVIQFLLQAFPESANQPTYKQNFPLSLASMEDGPNRDEIIRTLDFYIRQSAANDNKKKDKKGLCSRAARQRISQERTSAAAPSPSNYNNHNNNKQKTKSRRGYTIRSRSKNNAMEQDDPYDSATAGSDEENRVSNTTSSSRFKYIRTKSKRLAFPIKRSVRSAVSKSRRNKQSSAKSGFDMEHLIDETDIC